MKSSFFDRYKVPLFLSLIIVIGTTFFQTAFIFLPLFILIYGYFSDDKIEAPATAVLSHMTIYLYILLISGDTPTSDTSRFIRSSVYWIILSFIGATIGYFASLKTRIGLAASTISLAVWQIIFYMGLD
jgi:hypothetical protein